MLKRNSAEIIQSWQFSFEDEPWQPVTTPHSWNAFDTMHVGEGWYRRGVGTYETELTTSAEKRTFIRFGAASQKAVVTWNGAEIGRNIGGYLPFTVELPQAATGILGVAVDNSPDIDLIPSDRSDFFLYGGLTRPITRFTTGALSIGHVHVDAQLQESVGQLHVRLHVDGEGVRARCRVEICDPDGAIVHTGEQRVDSAETTLALPSFSNPQLWSPDTPYLYKIRLLLWHNDTLSDEVNTHFGWRTFDFPAGGPFYLNGERLLLRGTHRHEDWAGCASALSEADTRAEFENMKAVGLNFIRLGHYPQADFVHTLCDELGIIVWDELPWCRGGVGGDLFKARARDMLRTMIAEHRHHPSIIFWGMGNELDWEYDHVDNTDDDVFAFLQELHNLSHALDPTRLTALRRYERGASVVDVYSPSIWSGWYRGRYQDYEWALTDAQRQFPRMLHMEWSADNHVGRHNSGPHLPFELERERDHSEQDGLAYSNEGFARASRDGDWSESYFLDLAAWTLRVQQEQPNLAGAAQWAFKDFGTPLRPENPIPYVNQKGIVDRANRPKTAFYLFQAAQTDTPVCHIEAHSWPVRAGNSAEKQRIRVITNCESVELFVNGVSQSLQTDGWLRTWWVTMQANDNELHAVGYMADGSVVEDSMTQMLVHPTDAPPAQWLAHVEQVTWREQSALCLTVQMADADGTPIINHEQRVHFQLTAGNGQLLGDLGTIDGSPTVETSNGRAMILLTDIGAVGVTINVTSDLIASEEWSVCNEPESCKRLV
jgi:beta-galactosidase